MEPWRSFRVGSILGPYRSASVSAAQPPACPMPLVLLQKNLAKKAVVDGGGIEMRPISMESFSGTKLSRYAAILAAAIVLACPWGSARAQDCAGANPPVLVNGGSLSQSYAFSTLTGWYSSTGLGTNDYGNPWALVLGYGNVGIEQYPGTQWLVNWPPPTNTPLQVQVSTGLASIACVDQNPSYDWDGPWTGYYILHVDTPGAQVISTWSPYFPDMNPFQQCVPSGYVTGEIELQYDSPGTKSITMTAYICDYLTPTANLGSQTTIFFNVFPQIDAGPCEECEQIAGQPINLATGDVWTSKTDYSVPGLAGGLSVTRTWNSLWNQTNPPFNAGMFGDGWTSDFEERLQTPGGYIKYWNRSGNSWIFKSDPYSGNTWDVVSPPNQHASIYYNQTTSQYTLSFADGSSKIFNAQGYLTAVSDRNGNQTALQYDANARIMKITAPGGQWIAFTYGNSVFPNLVTSAQDGVGTVATYAYNGTNLTQVVYPDGSQLDYFYDSNNNVTTVTDGLGQVIETHTYDSASRGLTSSRANGVDAITIQYPSSGTTILTDSFGNSTTYSYSTILTGNYLTAIQGPGCDSCGGRNNQTFALDSSGNRQSVTDPNGNIVSYTYDSSGNVLARTDATGTWTYTYDSFGEVLTARDPLGNTTTNVYDFRGNLTSITTPSPDGGTTPGSQTSFTYDSNGDLLTITDPLGNGTTLTYYSTGLINTVKDAQRNTTTFAYDGRGNRTSIKDASGNTTTFTYDSMNRLTKITYPNNSTTQFAYDQRGRRTSITDADNNTARYAYDDADRLVSVADTASNATQYSYDTENNLTSVTDALNRTTTFSYDNLSRLTKTLFPSNLFETYVYDNNGNLTSKSDRNGNTVTYTYDQLNRLAAKFYPDSTSASYTYDADSRLTQVIDPTGTYAFTYDDMGRLIATTTSYSFLGNRNFTTHYAYDAASNRTSFTDPESGITSYAYDSLNRLGTLTPPSAISGGSFGFSYDALSRRTQLTRPNRLNTNYTYDSLSRLLSVSHMSGRTTLDGASYTMDAAGNRTSRTPLPSGAATNFTYDAVYELLSATQGSTTKESYSYDAVGNRLSSLTVSPYSYNASNELSSTPGASYTYDANGNMLTKTDSTGTTTNTWDFENRLTSVTIPGSGGVVTLKYDPFGRRIYKSSSLGTSVFVYDGDNIIEETNSSGAVVARYAQGLNVDEPLAEVRSGTTSYYEADGLGSVTSLSSSKAALAATYTYDSFGNLTASTGTLTNPLRYTGREFDSETNLYFYRARYYDPTVGRFLNEDPMRFGAGPNFFAYVLNSPTNSLDPFGLQGLLGNNPTPKMTGNDLDVFNQALDEAKKAASCDPNCDGAVQDHGIKSLAALVNQMTANLNVYDGRKSTYPFGKQTVSQYLSQGTAAAVAFTDVELTFLGNYFWNPTSIDNMPQQRALILLHESVHEFGHKSDTDFGLTDGSRKLSEKIAEKCFPALKALKGLGNLTN